MDFNDLRLARNKYEVLHALEQIVLSVKFREEVFEIAKVTPHETKQKAIVWYIKFFIDQKIFEDRGIYLSFNDDYTKVKIQKPDGKLHPLEYEGYLGNQNKVNK